MSTFITGATGYLGSYVVDTLMRETDERVTLLVRAKDQHHAHERLWKSLQLHTDFDTFAQWMQERVEVALGDLTAPQLGFDSAQHKKLARSIDSVIHIAASLNRKSAKACFNTNLRGTLDVIKLARAAHEHHGLKRFSDVSTVAVAGHRQSETVTEDDCLDWSRSHYDPYGRTKAFCEHMLHELLPDVSKLVFRPSTVMGDSRFPQTTQFDMVRSYVFLADLPALPFRPQWRMDIVPADFVGSSIARLHVKAKPKHEAYHLSAGDGSQNYREITEGLRGDSAVGGRRRIAGGFLPAATAPVGAIVNTLGSLRARNPVTYGASLLKVFWPYLTFDTVFDNRRVVEELGVTPAPFTDYAAGLYDFCKSGNFTYPYRPWPAGVVLAAPTKRRRRKRA